MRCTLGIDIGTSSSKGVLVDADGRILSTAVREHRVDRPRAGWVEMDSGTWWEEVVALSSELIRSAPHAEIVGVGISGMGPCVLLTDRDDEALRPAILYGIDTRATRQIAQMTAELGAEEIVRVAGSALSTQAGGPKIAWIRENEPTLAARAERVYMPASWVVKNLTGAYILDHHSASQMSPLYNVAQSRWHDSWWERYAGGLEQPALLWAGDIAGHVTRDAATATGIPAGTPVIAGTIDAWAEAVSVGAHEPGRLMLMYGTTMFLIATSTDTLRVPSMWTTVGAFPGTRNLAGGLAASGALTTWVRDITGTDYAQLLHEAECSGPGARGLLMLPYFAGERTPIQDPDARGVLAGLTLDHTRGDVYRAVLEATAFGVRHNIETMRSGAAAIDSVVAVGGGTRGPLWMQVVSDVTGLAQQVPRTTVGASYGGAFLAAAATANGISPAIADWNPITSSVQPDYSVRGIYDELFNHYLRLYQDTADLVHELVAAQGTVAHRHIHDPLETP